MPAYARETADHSSKKTEILKVAAALFAQNGYAAVSIRDLAGAVHTTPAALYHHFSSKDAIYRATLTFVFSERVATATQILSGNEPPEAMLQKLVGYLIRDLMENRLVTRFAQQILLLGDAEQIRFVIKEILAEPFREIENLMRRLSPEGDATSSATSILSLILGYVELAPVMEELSGQRVTGDRAQAFADHACRLLLHGLTNTNPGMERP